MRDGRRCSVLAMAGLLVAACVEEDSFSPPDAGPGRDADVGTDAAQADASIDAALEDAAPDAGADAGPPVNPLEGAGEVTLVDSGYTFVEGPQWRPAEGVLLFSDIDGDTIYELTPPSAIEVFRSPSGNSNGLAIDTEGRLLAAEHGNRRVSRTLGDGTIVSVVEQYEGQRLNSPNDIAVRSDGTLYFTDPPYGIDAADRELDFNGVFVLDRDGALSTVWRGDTDAGPNGIALSPDESLLYVTDSAAAIVHVFDVHASGGADNERPFVPTAETPDGMTVDRAGNLYVSSSAGIEVFAPDATLWGTIAVPRQPANCAFGGADGTTLYITAIDTLYSVEMPVSGIH